MIKFRTWVSITSMAAVAFFSAVPEAALAKGGRGGGGGRPHVSAPHMPRQAMARSSQGSSSYRPRTNTNIARPQTNVARTQSNTSTNGQRRNYAQQQRAYSARRPRTNSYVRRQATSNRAISSVVHQLRSIHSSLVHDIHDYKGHRAAAAHSVSMAIRHLSHSSYGGSSSSGGSNSGISSSTLGSGSTVNGSTRRTSSSTALNNTNGNVNGNGTGSRRSSMNQAQSDARVRHSMQRLSQVASRLQSIGTSSNHGRALTEVHRAHQHLAAALRAR